MRPIEAELRAFIARLSGVETEAQLLKRQVLALDQGVRDLWADGRGSGRYRVVNFDGAVEGCDGVALSGSSLRLVGHVTGIDYGTYSLAAGTFNFDLAIDERDFAISFDGYTTGPSTRWAVAGGPQGVPANTGFVFPVAAIPAAGYSCYGGVSAPQCHVPLAGSMTLTDKYGTVTVSYGAFTLSGIGYNGWFNSGATPARYLIDDATSYSVISGGIVYGWSNANATWTQTCATDSGVKFDLVITIGTGAGPYLAGDTVHIFEP